MRGALWLVGFLAGPLAAQAPRGFEAGLLGVAAFAEPAFKGGGVTLGYRPDGRLRVAAAVLAGEADGFQGRGELTLHYLITPALLTGAGLYGMGGVAGELGERDRGYVLLGLGLEGAPGGTNGWFLEAGVGGGARVAAGWRWRWLAPARRR